MDGWTLAFIATTVTLTAITVRDIIKRERLIPKATTARRLARRGHSPLATKMISYLLRRHYGQTELDKWYRDNFKH